MKWLQRIWHDPVGSKIIAAAILAIFAGATALYWSTVRVWLNEEVPVSHSVLIALILGALLVGWAITHLSRRNPVRQSASQLPEVIPSLQGDGDKSSRDREAADAQPGELGKDLVRFFADIERLEGRFAELEEYRRIAVGCSVRWSGEVLSVKKYVDDITLSIRVPGTMYGRLAFIEFPLSLSERLFALRKGDHVCISGTIHGVRNDMPTVRGETFEVVLPTP